MPRQFEPISRESTASLIARQLREAIMNGDIPAGTQLSEASLSQQFGVSRGPLREAMQRLVQEGLVRSERNRGLFVKVLAEDDIRDIYTARTATETSAALLVLREHAEEAVGPLREACAAMTAASAQGDLTVLSDADLRFHEVLVDCSRSPRLKRMHDTLLVETRMCLTALQGTYPDPDVQVAEHTRIVDAIARGDEAMVMTSIADHMAEAVRQLTGPAAASAEPGPASV